jgi:hypothetical protein
MATLVCPQVADSPDRPSTPAPNECTEKHTSPDGAQRNPGMGATTVHFPRIPLRCIRATCCAFFGASAVFSDQGA